MYVCMYVRKYMYVCMYVCMYVYTHIIIKNARYIATSPVFCLIELMKFTWVKRLLLIDGATNKQWLLIVYFKRNACISTCALCNIKRVRIQHLLHSVACEKKLYIVYNRGAFVKYNAVRLFSLPAVRYGFHIFPPVSYKQILLSI